MKYCTLFPRDDGKYSIYTAPRHYFIETRADMEAVRKEVGYDILQERMLNFQKHSTKRADPAQDDDEESEDFPDQPEAAMEGSSGASEVPREPDRLLVTSGAESGEWIAAGNKRDAPEVRDVAEVRLPDTTSGSEAQQEEEETTWSYAWEREDFIEGLLSLRRREVMLYALRYAVSDRVAAEQILDETLQSMGRHLARESRHVESVLMITLRDIWDSATASERAMVREPDPPVTEEDSSPRFAAGFAERYACA